MKSQNGHLQVVMAGGFAVLFLAPVLANAQVASALLHEDEEVLPGETISALNNTAVNHVGGYACSMTTAGTATVSRIWGNPNGSAGMLLRSEGTFGNYEQTSFESFYGMSDDGHLAYSPISTDTNSGTTGLDGVWLDDTPVLVELDPVPSLPGQFCSFGSRAGITGDGVPWWVGGITDTEGGATQNRVLFHGLGANVAIMGDDTIPGIVEPVSTGSSGIDFDWRVSRFGAHWIDKIGVTSGSSNDGVMVIDGQAITAGGGIIREGSPVPTAVGGLPGELWANFDNLGINENSDYLITGDTSAATTEDEFVMLSGLIVLREGQVLELDGMPVTVAGAIEGGYMNAQTDWAVTWDVDTPGGNIEALIFNGRILLAEGDPVDWNADGLIDANDNGGVLADFTGISTVTVGARQGANVPIYFTADIDFGGTLLEGFFCLNILVGDVNGDGIVNAADLALLLGSWGPYGPCPPYIPADLNHDCIVNAADLALLLGNWG